MKCERVMEILDAGEEALPVSVHLRIWVHLLFCPCCAGELKMLETAREIMRTGFLPPSPDFTESLMTLIEDETGEEAEGFETLPQGFSTRSWVITGIIILVSLASSFFGMDFIQVASSQGDSFLFPLGLTIGLVLSCYGALFIGSHLKELSVRFKLH
jgi:hypothetical protein